MKLKSLIFECINVANISFITVFILFIDMMRNEIKVLIFGRGGMYSIHCWNKFLCIIGAYFYILLEQLSVHFHTILYIVGAYFYVLLEHF